MQPDVAGGFAAVGQQRIVGVFTIATSETAPCRRARRIAVQPFNNAACEGLCLGLRTRQSAIEFDNARAFVKEDLPVLGRPSVAAGPEQCHDLGLVPGKRVEHRGAAVPRLPPAPGRRRRFRVWTPAARAALRAATAFIAAPSTLERRFGPAPIYAQEESAASVSRLPSAWGA